MSPGNSLSPRATVMKTYLMNRTHPLVKSVLVLLLISLTACTEKTDPELELAYSRLDSLSGVLDRKQLIIDSLEGQLIENQNSTSGYPIHFPRKYRKFEDPESYVRNSLQNKPEKIPIEGVLGGTMQFRKIDILTSQWLLAVYDDGHIQGTSIYAYDLKPNDSLEFSILLSE